MRTNPPSVLILTNSLGGGGAELTMLRIHKGLLANGIDTLLIGVNKDRFNIGLESEKIRVLDREWNDGLTSTLRAIFDLRKVISEMKFTHIIINCELPELLIAFLPLRNIEKISVEHTSRPWSGRRALGILVRKILSLRDFKWVSVVRDQKVIWGTNKIPKYIPNPYLQIKERNSNSIKAESVVFIGRIRPEKNVELVINAAISAGRKIDIFGDGNQKEMLEEKFSKNELVKFHGQIENPWEKISPLAIVVVASDYEGDGMVVIEAIMNDCQILLMDNKDLRRFELPETNYFKNINDLRNKLEVRDSTKKKKFEVPPRIKEEISKARNFDAILSEWESLLSEES